MKFKNDDQRDYITERTEMRRREEYALMNAMGRNRRMHETYGADHIDCDWESIGRRENPVEMAELEKLERRVLLGIIVKLQSHRSMFETRTFEMGARIHALEDELNRLKTKLDEEGFEYE